MSIRGVFTDNLLLKVLALLLAVILCLFVWLETGVEENQVLPVKLVNLPTVLQVQQTARPEIVARFSGPRILLIRQSRQKQSLTLDMAGSKPGPISLAGLEQQLQLVRGVKIISVQPATPELTLGLKAGQGE